jgi:chemotaxis protein methyltransferase CheR
LTFPIDSFHIDRFKGLITDGLGFQVEDDGLALLEELLQERLRDSGCRTVDAYLDGLRDPERRHAELRAAAQRLTIGETYFFRLPEQYRALAEVALPDRLCERQGHGPVRILSAGCATGEEAYTVALLLREAMPDLDPRDVAITGVDVNSDFLSKARKAQFSPWSLRGLAPDLRKRYFREENRTFHLDPTLTAMVRFDERNLLSDDGWEREAFDIIFCRNVFIYFSPEATRKALSRLTQALAPGGYMFLGPAETLRGISREFRLIHTHEAFYYQQSHDTPSQAPQPGQAPARPDTSWVDAVQRASERIASLTAPAPDSQVSLPDFPLSMGSAARLAWDLTPALELFKQERFTEALASLRALPPEAIRDADVLLLLAAILTNADDRTEAERVCQEILALDAFSAGAHYLLALCAEQAEDVEAARRHNETAATLDPAFAMPRLHLGLLAKRRGALDQARRELERAQVLLSREEASRMVLFGGGFNREALMGLCAAEIRRCQEAP